MEKHGVGNQVRTASDQVLERLKKIGVRAPLPTNSERILCVLFVSWAFSQLLFLLCCREQSQPG